MGRPFLGIFAVADVVVFEDLLVDRCVEQGSLPLGIEVGGRSLRQGLEKLVDRIESDDGGWVDGLEAGVLEFGCDETQEVGALPFLFGIPEFGAIALLVVQPEKFLNVADNRFQLGQLEFGDRAFWFLWYDGVLSRRQGDAANPRLRAGMRRTLGRSHRLARIESRFAEKFEMVNNATASRCAESFEWMLTNDGLRPNRVTRFCTSEFFCGRSPYVVYARSAQRISVVG